MAASESGSNTKFEASDEGLTYIKYSPDREEEYVAAIRELVSDQLSEPYSIYVYRYFLYQWGDLCFMAMDAANQLVGVVVSKLEPHRNGPMRGYIAMLAVRVEWRGRGIATKLVQRALDAMIERDAEEACLHPQRLRGVLMDQVVLEAETTNSAAMKLYERLGFLRSKRLHRYYLNGNTAYRFVLYVKATPATLNRPVGFGEMEASFQDAAKQKVERDAVSPQKEEAGEAADTKLAVNTNDKKNAKAKGKAKSKGRRKGKGKA